MGALRIRPAIPYIVISVLALILAGLPYVLAWQNGDAQKIFAGFLLNTQDGNSYLAKMMQGWQCAWLFTLPFTAEKGQGVFLFGYYLFLGHAARSLGLSLILTYHLARLLGAGWMFYRLYMFLDRSIGIERGVKLAFFAAALGGGLGWLALPFGAFTSDFWVAEGYPFLSALINAHFPLTLGLVLYLLTPESGETPHLHKKIPGVLLASVLLSWASPFGVVLVVGVRACLLVWSYLEKRLVRNDAIALAGMLLGGLPLLLYDVWVTATDPLLAAWNAQNITASPPAWDTFISLAPCLILAVPGAWAAVKSRHTALRAALVWAGLGLVLMYLPWSLQRRFMLGLWAPLAGLAAYGLLQISANSRASWLVTGLWVAVMLPTNLITLAAVQVGIARQDSALYLDASESAAMTWMVEYLPAGSVVLSGPESGLLIPAHSGLKVIYGHPFETVAADAKREAVEKFFLDPARIESDPLLRDAGYIYLSPRDPVPEDFNLPPGFELVYSNEKTFVYRVDR
jgi:hypothetical protein